MKRLGNKDILVVSAFGFNVATIISCVFNISFWVTLFASTVFLGLAVIRITEEEE